MVGYLADQKGVHSADQTGEKSVAWWANHLAAWKAERREQH